MTARDSATAAAVRAVGAVGAFSVSLGATAVVLPVLALSSGIAPPVVALMASGSATAQLLVRFVLPWLLARVPDREVLAMGALLMASSIGLVASTRHIAAFAVAQALQGVARALFWTSSQNHAVGMSGPSVRRLAQLGMATKLGMMVGPVVAGLLVDRSMAAALAFVAGGALAATGASFLMERRPGIPRKPRAQRTVGWRRRDVSLGYWVSHAAGGWTGLLESYVPIVLVAAGATGTQIGWLVATASAFQLAASAYLARYPDQDLVRSAVLASALVIVAGGAVPFMGANLVLAAAVMAVAGTGAGLCTTLGPAIATANVDTSDRGGVLAVLGGYRSVGRMAAPAGVAWASGLAGLTVALPMVALCLAGPALVLTRYQQPRHRDDTRVEGAEPVPDDHERGRRGAASETPAT